MAQKNTIGTVGTQWSDKSERMADIRYEVSGMSRSNGWI
jgi:hypothetical protein